MSILIYPICYLSNIVVATYAKLQIIIKNDLGEDDKLRIRYFKDALTCADGEILICNQWGIGNIQGMIDKAKELGMKVTSLNKQ